MANRTLALLGDGACGCPVGTPVVFRITRSGFICTRCLGIYMQAQVGMASWPIEIYASKVGAGLPLQDELCRQSARALAVAEIAGEGNVVAFGARGMSILAREGFIQTGKGAL